MGFCRICCKKLSETIKFCGNCGTKTNFDKKKKTTKTKEFSAFPSHTDYKSGHEVIGSLPQKENNKLKIFATLVVISLLLSSLLFLYAKRNDEGDENKISEMESFDGATVHLQLNYWRTVEQGQDSSSLPDPWIRVYTGNGQYENTKVWKNSLEWYGDIRFRFNIAANEKNLGIAYELYDYDGDSIRNPNVSNSTLMDVNPNVSGSSSDSRRVSFWYNLSTSSDGNCITTFDIESKCSEGVSLSSGLPRYNVVEMAFSGFDDGVAYEYDSYVSFTIWWEKSEDNISDDFHTSDMYGDGVKDYKDYNDDIDVGITVNLDKFGILANNDEYVNLEVFINGDSRYLLGQTGDSVRINAGETKKFNETFFFDLDDTKEYSIIQFVAYSSGSLFSSNFDLDGNMDDSNVLTLFFYTSTGNLSENYNGGYANGNNDSGSDAATDAILYYSVDITDTASLGELRNFEWNYGSKNYNYEMIIDPDVYYYFKSLEHDLSFESDWPAGYARFATPDEQYVINLANDLNSIAVSEGFTDLETANFILSFVQTIDYKVDNYTNYQGIQEYPKYPVEMLWDGQGDCEDSSALFASLMEALGYDAVLLLFLGDGEGHAAIGISVSGASGTSYSYGGVEYYYAETTDTGTSIGVDPTYYFYGLDMSRASYTYDV